MRFYAHLWTRDGGAAHDHFGYSVAISGEIIVVGASHDDTASGADSGCAYVFEPLQ